MEIISKSDKMNTLYKYRDIGMNGYKDIDLQKRTVTGIYNSYFYIDSDLDMLLPGASKKSISERGPKSNAIPKIKHLKNHDWDDNIARIELLEEKEVLFNNEIVNGIYHESYYPKTTLANDMLINIQEGIYDNRSIGFNYIDLVLARKESEDEDQRNRYQEYIQLAVNPEVADKSGYFWIVKEIRLWEGSDVTFGANSQTPMLGIKSQNKDVILIKLFEKMDLLGKQLRTGKQSDESMKIFEIQVLQLKQEIKNIMSLEPDIKKDTLFEPSEIVTTQKRRDYKYLIDNY